MDKIYEGRWKIRNCLDTYIFFNHFTLSKEIKQGVAGCERICENNIIKKREKKEQQLRRQEITVDIEFQFLKIEVNNKVRSRERILQARSASEETISIELAVISSHVICQMMRPYCQSSTALTFIKSRYYRGKYNQYLQSAEF